MWQDSIAFIEAMKLAIPTISKLLGSKSSTDVLEAVDFFVASSEFGVTDALLGVRRMMLLVWSKEASVKDAVVRAYRQLYFRPDEPPSR